MLQYANYNTNMIILKNKLIKIIALIVFIGLNNINATAQNKIDENRTIKILAIGNSFSDDAVEHYLYGLVKAGGHKIVIGNLFKGGASLSQHWDAVQNDNPIYEYRKIDSLGKKDKIAKVSLATALLDEDWDYISFQQSSTNSGLLDTYLEPLPKLLSFVKSKIKNKDVKYVFHQTWAYANSSKHKGFANYNNSQLEMYRAITNASKKMFKLYQFDLIIPSGTAIQNGRTSSVGDNFCRDGHHLDYRIGRYTAACAWYSAIYGNVVGNTYTLNKLSDNETLIAQKAAELACKKPYKISKINL